MRICQLRLQIAIARVHLQFISLLRKQTATWQIINYIVVQYSLTRCLFEIYQFEESYSKILYNNEFTHYSFYKQHLTANTVKGIIVSAIGLILDEDDKNNNGRLPHITDTMFQESKCPEKSTARNRQRADKEKRRA